MASKKIKKKKPKKQTTYEATYEAKDIYVLHHNIYIVHMFYTLIYKLFCK